MWRDDLGSPVGLNGPARRVVSLVPSLTEAVARSAPGLLVGATDWCTHPADLAVTRVRGTKNPERAAIIALAPDLVIATGAIPSRSGFSSVNPLVERLPGTDQGNVLTVWDVLLETRPVGKRVVVLDDDGTRVAAGVTEVLLDRGSEVVAPHGHSYTVRS